MAGPTKEQLAREIAPQVQGLEKQLVELQSSNGLRLDQAEKRLDELLTADEKQRAEIAELRSKLSSSESRIAVLEERARQLEKLSDRSWQFWLAILAASVAILLSIFKK